MKLQQALETARDCGLETVGEAIYNINIHAPNLFSYDKMNDELKELSNEWDWVKLHRNTPDGKSGITEETSVELLLYYHIAEDMTDYKIYQQALKNDSFAKRLADE